MKTFTISSSDLDTAFDKLYTFCKDNGCNFVVSPTLNAIEVFKIQGDTSYMLLSTIQIADIAEPYEVIKDLQNIL